MNQAKDIIITAFLKENFPRIKDWTVGDIRRASRIKKSGKTGRNGSLIGAYMLWCCAVDYFGGLLIGPNSETPDRIKAFVNQYLKKYGNYNHEKVYELRWSLLHYYTPRGYSILAQEEEEISLHLKKTNLGDSIHLGSAISDLEKAVKDFEEDIKIRPSMRDTAFEYYKKHKVIRPVELFSIKILGDSE